MSSALIREPQSASTSKRWILPAGLTTLTFVAGFLRIPGDLAAKTHAVLHGVCAQRPSHSLLLGASTLPLDARMTGMYIAVATFGVWLLATKRIRRTKRPSRSVAGVLAVFALALAGDGFNALAFDLGLPHPYEPSNALRLATGILGGTALAIGLAYLFAGSIWASGERHRAPVEKPGEIMLPLAVASGLGGLVLSGLPILYAPYALGLLVAVIMVFATMGMILLALMGDRGWSFRSGAELGWLAVGGIVAGLVTIGVLSWLRFVAETRFGFPQFT